MTNPSGHTQIDGTLEKHIMNREITRQVVSGFVSDVLRGENPDKLTSYFDGDTYIQHNTGIAGGCPVWALRWRLLPDRGFR